MPRLHIHFKCPADFTVSELGQLSRSVGFLYDNMELVAEGANPFIIYSNKRREYITPKERLVVKKIKYGSDLVITGVAAGVAAAFIAALQFSGWLKDRHEAAVKRKINKDLIKNYLEQNPEAKSAIDEFAKKAKMEPDRVLEYVEPEIMRLLSQRPVLKDARILNPKKDKSRRRKKNVHERSQ